MARGDTWRLRILLVFWVNRILWILWTTGKSVMFEFVKYCRCDCFCLLVKRVIECSLCKAGGMRRWNGQSMRKMRSIDPRAMWTGESLCTAYLWLRYPEGRRDRKRMDRESVSRYMAELGVWTRSMPSPSRWQVESTCSRGQRSCRNLRSKAQIKREKTGRRAKGKEPRSRNNK